MDFGPTLLCQRNLKHLRSVYKFDGLTWLRYDQSHCLYLDLNNQETSHFYWHQFWDRNDCESICHWNYFQIPRALSELPAEWPHCKCFDHKNYGFWPCPKSGHNFTIVSMTFWKKIKKKKEKNLGSKNIFFRVKIFFLCGPCLIETMVKWP